MNKLLLTLLSALTFSIALPAVAGPDWQAIEYARKAQRSQAQARSGAASAGPQAALPTDCPLPALVLPLDHGPRAQTTPYANERRRQRYAAQNAACEGAAK